MRETTTISPHFCVRCGRHMKPGTVCNVNGHLDSRGHFVNDHICLECGEVWDSLSWAEKYEGKK